MHRFSPKVTPHQRELVLNMNHGLGNQLSLYFAGLAYAKHHNLRLVSNVAIARQDNHESFRDILDLNLPGTFNVAGRFPSPHKSKLDQFLSYRLPITFNFTGNYYSPTVGYDEFLLSKRGIRNLHGFFHTYKYFEYCLAEEPTLETKEIFHRNIFANQLSTEIQKPNSVALHIRRGDYVGSAESLGLLGSKYYQNALAIIGRSCRIGNVFVFSDDIEFAKALFVELGVRNTIFPEENGFLSAKEVIYLLGVSPNLVIANSSLSYWAAVFAGENSFVIAQSPFYKNAELSETYFYKPNWTLVNPEFR